MIEFCRSINKQRRSKANEQTRKMKAVLHLSVVGAVVCVHLLLINGSFGQTSSIEMGTLNFPVIYNQTISIPAVHRPWYKRLFGWVSRSPVPIQNVTYIFPPQPPPPSPSSLSSNQVGNL